MNNRAKEKNSEAGNRTPVVRVTGGNTKPLYYFGSVFDILLGYIDARFTSIHLGFPANKTNYNRYNSYKHF